jgi:hypothetical protein
MKYLFLLTMLLVPTNVYARAEDNVSVILDKSLAQDVWYAIEKDERFSNDLRGKLKNALEHQPVHNPHEGTHVWIFLPPRTLRMLHQALNDDQDIAEVVIFDLCINLRVTFPDPTKPPKKCPGENRSTGEDPNGRVLLVDFPVPRS